MMLQFLIFLNFVMQAFAQDETTQAAEETTTAKSNTGLSENLALLLIIYDS